MVSDDENDNIYANSDANMAISCRLLPKKFNVKQK